MSDLQENRDDRDKIDVQAYLNKRAMVVLTANELDKCKVEIKDPKVLLKIRATAAGGILTGSDIERIVKRWVNAGCPNPIKYNETTNGLRDSIRAKEEELIRLSNKLHDGDTERHKLEEQATNLKGEIRELKIAVEQEKNGKDSLSKHADALEKKVNAQKTTAATQQRRIDEAQDKLDLANDFIDSQKITAGTQQRQIDEAQDKLDLANDFIDVIKFGSFFKRLWMAISQKYSTKLYEKIMK